MQCQSKQRQTGPAAAWGPQRGTKHEARRHKVTIPAIYTMVTLQSEIMGIVGVHHFIDWMLCVFQLTVSKHKRIAIKYNHKINFFKAPLWLRWSPCIIKWCDSHPYNVDISMSLWEHADLTTLCHLRRVPNYYHLNTHKNTLFKYTHIETCRQYLLNQIAWYQSFHDLL